LGLDLGLYIAPLRLYMALWGLYMGLLELNSVLGGCWHLLGTAHNVTSLGTVKAGLGTVCGAGSIHGAIGA